MRRSSKVDARFVKYHPLTGPPVIAQYLAAVRCAAEIARKNDWNIESRGSVGRSLAPVRRRAVHSQSERLALGAERRAADALCAHRALRGLDPSRVGWTRPLEAR